ncbi:U32 family peptidase [Ureaplasma diversum]|uniref:Holliday junction DNA helicase RuvB n=1 Tax=Ureaplasma diversum NCTC 246 TaxID=1188241 RepID=A0A084EX38_9BACT|nr:U32 family peptidase [Ureaplasma diversum]KEZ22530.1 Holliday junction DNA helicase RuvB [Ureaplasma diversum NCTC 246]
MKLVFTPTSYQNALDLIALKVDYIAVGSNQFATRNCFDCDLETLKQLIANKQETKIIVNVNAWFFDADLDALEAYLKELNKLEIEFVIFSDYAVAELVYENKLNLVLHYNSETTVTSAAQFDWFTENNILSVSLARELFFGELKAISMNNTAKLKLMIQGHGLLFIMHSRWNLLSNFDAYLQQFDQQEKLIDQEFIYIKESLRKYPNILKQDHFGTHMMSGYELCTINILDKILTLNLDYLYIDAYLHNDQYSLTVAKLYLEAMELINTNSYDQAFKDKAWEQLKAIAHNEVITNNFLGTVKDILHMEKEEEQ